MSRSDLINPGRTLPDISLPDATGAPRRLRASGDRSVLLILVHDGCEECEGWVAGLGGQRGEIETWKGKATIVSTAAGGGDPFPRLVDAEGRLASSVGVTAPAVVIADQWGEIHEAAEGHAFLPIESTVEWIRSLATQCPECEGEAY